MKPSRTDWQNFHAVNAPDGWDGGKAPDFLTAKPRSDAGIKRGRQIETTYLMKILRPFRDFMKRKLWPPGSVWMTRNNNGAFKRGGEWFHYGLGLGTHDGIGFVSVVVTPEMVGKQVAVFTTVEAKLDENSSMSDEQSAFGKAVTAAGGISMRADASSGLRIPDLLKAYRWYVPLGPVA